MRGHVTKPHGKFPHIQICEIDGTTYKLVNGMWILRDDPASYYSHLFPLYEGVPGYQRNAVEACLEVCPNRRTMIDGGAHIGLLALQFHRYFPAVHAFEPMLHNYVCLKENFANHANFEKFHLGSTVAIAELYPAALSNIDGTVQMARKGLKSWSWNVREVGEVEVACRTIDTLNLQDVDLIKLDVEGHELQALEGGLETIKRDRPSILIEEKFDRERKASALLFDLGMVKVWIDSYDILFTWPENVKTRREGRGWLATSPT
jgi:FkbM family methyltransferase